MDESTRAQRLAFILKSMQMCNAGNSHPLETFLCLVFFFPPAFHKLVQQKCYRSLSCEFLQPPSRSATPCAVSIAGWSWLSWLSCCTCFKHARTLHSLSVCFPSPERVHGPAEKEKKEKRRRSHRA